LTQRKKEVEAIIDTGATMLMLSQDVVNELGLGRIGERRYANNQIQLKSVYRGVVLELKGSEPLVGQ